MGSVVEGKARATPSSIPKVVVAERRATDIFASLEAVYTFARLPEVSLHANARVVIVRSDHEWDCVGNVATVYATPIRPDEILTLPHPTIPPLLNHRTTTSAEEAHSVPHISTDAAAHRIHRLSESVALREGYCLA